MLSPYRVLDLCDERGLLCGQILADLGADVIAVEPREGSRARRAGPFQKDVAGPERSLQWQAHARNRRGVALDLDDASDRRAFLALVDGADFLLESDAPGALAARGLGYDDLAARNPGLVYVSISPFGQDGPKADWAATDLIVQAACGSLVLSGEPDRAPLRTGGVSAFAYAGAEAAGAALVAHFERVRSGRGQHVDVSAQLSANLAAAFTLLSSRIGAPRASRSGGGVSIGPLRMPFIWPAADGFVSLTLAFDPLNAPFLRRLFDWLFEAGAIDAQARDRDWRAYLPGVLAGQSAREPFDALLGAIGDSCARARELPRALSSGGCCWRRSPRSTTCWTALSSRRAASGASTRSPDAPCATRDPSRASTRGPSPIVDRRRVSASTAPRFWPRQRARPRPRAAARRAVRRSRACGSSTSCG
jgi:crotonobetainyl-CoA:carnitine CoA-transferase CaiB-like acyl-CoA transferase